MKTIRETVRKSFKGTTERAKFIIQPFSIGPAPGSAKQHPTSVLWSLFIEEHLRTAMLRLVRCLRHPDVFYFDNKV